MADEHEQDWDFGALLLESLEQARAHRRGELTGVRTTRLTVRQVDVAPAPDYDPPKITALRQRIGLSQAVFARLLNVSPKTVQNWEQGTRQPDHAARRLIEILDRSPDVFELFLPTGVSLDGESDASKSRRSPRGRHPTRSARNARQQDQTALR